MLVMVIGVAGLVFGREAAEGALVCRLAELIGPESAEAVQAMLMSASSTRSGILATAIGIGTLIIAATAVFGQLQSALNVIWKAPASGNVGVWYLLKVAPSQPLGHPRDRLLAPGVARDQYGLGGVQRLSRPDSSLAGLATILHIVHLTLAFGFM